MAEETRRLTLRFNKEGLSRLKRAFSKVQDGLEAIDDGAEQAEGAVERLADKAERAGQRIDSALDSVDWESFVTLAEAAGESVEDAMDPAGDGVHEVGRKAQVAGQRMEQAAESAREEYQDLTMQIMAARGAVKAISGRTSVDLDVDRDVDTDGGGVSRRGRRGMHLPGELDEVAEAVSLFGRLPPQIQALTGASIAAVGAIGTAGGLAAAATALSAKFGRQGIQSDLDQLQARFRGVATRLSREFEPIIRQQVIPAGEAVADMLVSASDELAHFTDAVIEATTGLGEEGPEPRVPQNLPTGPGRGVAGVGSGLNSFQQMPDQLGASFGPDQRVDVPFDTPSIEALKGFRQRVTSEIVRPALNEIQAIREREDAGIISPKEELKAVQRVADGLDKKLRTARAKAPPMLFPKDLIQKNLDRLDRVQTKLQKIQTPEAAPSAPIPSVQTPSAPTLLEDGGSPADAFGGLGDQVERVGRQIDQMVRQVQTAGERIGTSIEQSLSRAGNRLFRAFGQAVSGTLFGGGGSPTRQRLQLFNAKQQVRRLRESLRQGQVSYREFSLRVQAAQKKVQQRQERLNETLSGGFVSGLDDMLSAAKRVFKQLIAQITQTIAKMAVLKSIATIFNVSSGGFFGSVISGMGGGAFLQGASPPSGGGAVQVNVQGQTRTDGRDLYTTYNSTARVQRRKGRS
jgi:hypothetical protein